MKSEMRCKRFSLFSAYATIPFSAPLYSKIKAVSESDEVSTLSSDQRRYLEQTLLSFKRNGAELDQETKGRVEEIESTCQGHTVREACRRRDGCLERVTTDESKLSGLPTLRLRCAQSAKSREQEGWRFTLQGPSFLSIMTYCDDRSVREHFYKSHSTRAQALSGTMRP